MRRLSFGLLAAGCLSVLATTTLVTAQTDTTCTATDTENMRIEEQCRQQGKRIVASIDSRQCRRVRCEEGSSPGLGRCTESDQRNSSIRQSCTGRIISDFDRNDCLILTCDQTASVAPQQPSARTQQCAELKEKLAMLRDGTSQYKRLWEQWRKRCDDAVTTTPVTDPCASLQARLSSLQVGSPEHTRTKNAWQRQCAGSSSSSVDGSVSCVLNGCQLTCPNGLALNVCQCPGGPSAAGAGSSSSEPQCSRFRDARTGLVSRVCR